MGRTRFPVDRIVVYVKKLRSEAAVAMKREPSNTQNDMRDTLSIRKFSQRAMLNELLERGEE